MTADGWTQAVRHQLGLGRLLPLGGPRDGVWIAEAAARAVLLRAAAKVPGVVPGALRITLADPGDAPEAAVPAPPAAFAPGPLRVTADFAATAAEPLPATASRLRLALASTAADGLGLALAEVDLRVTDLLEEQAEPSEVSPPQPARARQATDPDEVRAAAAALSVPGVTHLTGSLGGLGRAVHIEERQEDATLPHRHVRVEVAVDGQRRVLDVARQVRAAVRESLDDHPTVAVLVTTVS
ncbi:nucleopolyhedrovirus P10 family protein [Streptomyces sp. HUAS TT20]|uniref:nucleopolyhedrovirus P10 family protein n=1 Tax=Streptomyces sp. HUAS TT20 TaxID=3447509 RepID=UPI0021D92524|nr:nucleopolyhedrovirus P10 family protein [Streptomyces sp. HUAS 15-9]UXY26762.1 nucleopolyhedrovirus P10 family protein [Streptomyces sp. HUAS 15-9]